jgi:hypothetical protein
VCRDHERVLLIVHAEGREIAAVRIGVGGPGERQLADLDLLGDERSDQRVRIEQLFVDRDAEVLLEVLERLEETNDGGVRGCRTSDVEGLALELRLQIGDRIRRRAGLG